MLLINRLAESRLNSLKTELNFSETNKANSEDYLSKLNKEIEKMKSDIKELEHFLSSQSE